MDTLDGYEVVGPWYNHEMSCRLIQVTEQSTNDYALIRVLNDETDAEAVIRAMPMAKKLIKEKQDEVQFS